MKIKIIEAYRNIVAIADKELIGKQFEEGKKILNVKESFYDGELLETNELKEILQIQKKEDATFNIVGKKAIDLALEENIIHKDSVGEIAGIPYAIILL